MFFSKGVAHMFFVFFACFFRFSSKHRLLIVCCIKSTKKVFRFVLLPYFHHKNKFFKEYISQKYTHFDTTKTRKIFIIVKKKRSTGLSNLDIYFSFSFYSIFFNQFQISFLIISFFIFFLIICHKNILKKYFTKWIK